MKTDSLDAVKHIKDIFKLEHLSYELMQTINQTNKQANKL